MGDRDAGESERWGGSGGSCSDVTSAAGRQDGREKLPCATNLCGGGRKLTVWDGKNDFVSKLTFFKRDVAAVESLKRES